LRIRRKRGATDAKVNILKQQDKKTDHQERLKLMQGDPTLKPSKRLTLTLPT
jgi:hypothetical protein